MLSIRSCTFVLSSSLMSSPRDSGSISQPVLYLDSTAQVEPARLQGQHLALDWLRSAEPRLGEPRSTWTIGGERHLRRSRRRAGDEIDDRPDAPERDRRVLAPFGRIGDERAHVAVKRIHSWVGMLPAVMEA